VTVDSEQRPGRPCCKSPESSARRPRSIRIGKDLARRIGGNGWYYAAADKRIHQRFRNLDLIEYNTEHHLIIKEPSSLLPRIDPSSFDSTNSVIADS
jgi:hypothetical protein